ncbi:MAG: hypothetical protein HIU88_14125 [Acidobacteria bacterium]|nr:hypothetical protein [Acidobacteriota bacterium]
MTRATRRPATKSQAQADKLIAEVFDIASRTALDAQQIVSFPEFALQQAIRIIDGTKPGMTNIPAMIDAWAREDEGDRHAGGRPTSVSSRSVLIVMLMHALAHEDLTLRHMAHTLARRLNVERLEQLGLPAKTLDADVWYRRLDAAHKTLIRLIDTHPNPRYSPKDPDLPEPKDRITRHRKLTAQQRQELDKFRADVADTIAKRGERLNDLMFELVGNTVRGARPLLKSNKGDIALDATFTPILGKHSARDRSKPARSTTPEAGLYQRDGDHGVPEPTPNNGAEKSGHVVSKFGFETEVLTTTVGDGCDGPDLILGVTIHRPSETKDAARILIPRVARLGLPRGNVSVDRLYNNHLPENFHLVLLRDGYQFVFDYRGNQLGVQANYTSGMKWKKGKNDKQEWVRDRRAHEVNHFIMVEGTWYLHFMPQLLIDAVKRSRLDKKNPNWIDDDKLAELILKREKYQLKAVGGPDEDGYQLYDFPPNSGYIAVDPITAVIIDKPTARRVTIPTSVGIRWAQKYPYMSVKWHEAYNLRTTVERTNNLLKHPTLGDLANPYRRQYRGYTPTALAVAMMATSHNMDAADYYLRWAEGIDLVKNKHRQTRPKQRPHGSRIEGIERKRDNPEAA